MTLKQLTELSKICTNQLGTPIDNTNSDLFNIFLIKLYTDIIQIIKLIPEIDYRIGQIDKYIQKNPDGTFGVHIDNIFSYFNSSKMKIKTPRLVSLLHEKINYLKTNPSSDSFLYSILNYQKINTSSRNQLDINLLTNQFFFSVFSVLDSFKPSLIEELIQVINNHYLNDNPDIKIELTTNCIVFNYPDLIFTDTDKIIHADEIKVTPDLNKFIIFKLDRYKKEIWVGMNNILPQDYLKEINNTLEKNSQYPSLRINKELL